MKSCGLNAIGFHVSILCISISVMLFAACFRQRSMAESQPSAEAAQRFLKLKGYEFDSNGFFAAVTSRDLAAINAFVAANFDLNARDATTGRTALIMAAARGDLPVVKSLAGSGVDLNAQDNTRRTALFHAIEARYDEVSEFLVVQP